ncbi:hypothetical protein SETIT_7G060900v2 [Setaria italica]|uniref:Uncharacterized protein n=1 Tax=Setaria italica TaxID=4555 RepID=A0A368RSQ6_SETIT|nr:hypothetical protein SETIT_7G060900v2 [Setaria italica]
MENDGHLNNNKEQALGLTLGDATAWDYPVEYDMDALLGEDHNVDTNQRTHDEDHLPESETPQSKRPKRFNVRQVQELEAMFHACTHPDAEQRQQLGTRIGLEERQVRFWFQNRRSLMKLKACGNEVKELQQENGKLQADNNELKQLMLDPTCFKCRDPAGATQTTLERQRLLRENARLKDELQRANAYLKRSIREAGRRPQPMSSENQASAYMNPVPFTCNRTNQATLRSHAERAFKELVMLATKGQPLWMPTIDGEVLNDQHYDLQTFPGLLGFCPWGFVAEATRETDMIKGEAMDLVSILTDVAQWSEMFPDIVSYVRSSNVICSGSSSLRDGLIQLMDVEFWVQTPCLPTRNVKFLRFSKMMAERKWAVVDVSVDGNQHGYQQQSSGASCTGYRLLPSGCILEGMRSGFCKVTWVVHGEYLEAAVPTLFRKFLHSGQAFGACRWLRSFQRQCEYMAVLASSHVPSSSSSSSGAAISSLGKRGVLELAQRMTASFYAAISGPVTIASTNITNQWCVSSGTAAERVDAAVRMVIWNCAEIMPGEPAITVLSATTTVRLPGTPPVRVFEYLCNLQRRGEWDSFVNGGQVKELGYVSTSARLHGNAVSVLRPTIVAQGSRGMNNNMLILQQSSTDASGSLVVYSLIEENVMRGIMAGAENNIFLVPSGFAILPDGHGKARYNAASSSTSAPIDNNDDDGEGALLTVAFQAMLPSSPSGDHATTRAFDNAGQQLCDAIKKIKDAVGANNVIVN